MQVQGEDKVSGGVWTTQVWAFVRTYVLVPLGLVRSTVSKFDLKQMDLEL